MRYELNVTRQGFIAVFAVSFIVVQLKSLPSLLPIDCKFPWPYLERSSEREDVGFTVIVHLPVQLRVTQNLQSRLCLLFTLNNRKLAGDGKTFGDGSIISFR
jgi:hypothetical protein